MTEIDVAKLRSLAENATPGQWAWTCEPGDDEACLEAVGADGYVLSAHGMHTEGFVDVEAPDAEFIAAANPATVLALLDRLERAEARLTCDGACNYNDGPDEECSAHGRSPRELWEFIAHDIVGRDKAVERAERAEAAIERVRALHRKHHTWTDECEACEHAYPCTTVAALDTEKEKNDESD